MKGWVKSTLVLLIILLLSTIFFALIYRPPDPEAVPDAPLVSFEISISWSGIDPSVIHVNAGSLVHFNVTSVGEDHHFGMPSFGISRWVAPNETVGFRVHANLEGTFTYRCLITAPDHVGEEGALVVMPRAS